jgi:sugar-specific transcriptional regulator TrmB
LGEEQIKITLKDFGLTEKEASIYIFLAKHGLLKGSEISKYTATNKAEIYRILRNLQHKGLIEPTLQSPTRYMVVSFEKIIDLQIETKQAEAAKIEKAREELMNYWTTLSHTEIDPVPQKFVVIEGRQKMYSKISQMITGTKHHLSIISSLRGLMQAYELGHFDSVLDRISKSIVNVRFLTEISQDNTENARKFLHELNTAGLEFQGRTPELGLRLFPRMVIRDDEEIVLFIGSNGPSGIQQDNTCIWTNSTAIAQAFVAVFEELWKNSIEIEQKITQIKMKRDSPKPQIFDNPVAAQKKYEEILRSARKKIVIMTSSEGLVNLCRDWSQIEKWANTDVAVKVMAPITNDNLEVAQQLTKLCNVRHVPLSYLVTAIVDDEYLFQAKTCNKMDFKLSDAFYADNIEIVKRTQKMLSNIWELASPPTLATVKSFESSSPAPMITPDAVSKFLKKMKSSPPEDLPRGFFDSGVAFIHPPAHLNIPTIAIRIFSYNKGSTFGEGNNIDVRLLLQGASEAYSFVQVAAANTNSKAAIPEKAIFAGCPASENYQIVKQEQLQVRRKGNTLFCGWTFPIPLPPTQHILPPAALLIEGYGEPRHSRTVGRTPSGYRLVSESDTLDAFVTFIDPLWKYNGPGSQGQVCLNSTMTVIPPKRRRY